MIEPGIYEHYKGNLYHVISVAEHTETAESMVVYIALQDPAKVWVRPLPLFSGPVITATRKTSRFRYVRQATAEERASLVGLFSTESAAGAL